MEPRFTVNSFNNVVCLQCNARFAADLYVFVRSVEASGVTVDPAIFAMTEQIRNQFFRMNKLDQLDLRISTMNREQMLLDQVRPFAGQLSIAELETANLYVGDERISMSDALAPSFEVTTITGCDFVQAPSVPVQAPVPKPPVSAPSPKVQAPVKED